MVLIFPPEKLEILIPWIDKLIHYGYSHKKELEKLLGNLQRASLALFPMKAFLRRLERHLYTPGLPYNVITTLDRYSIEDLKIWRYGLIHCMKGIPIEFLLKSPEDADIHAFSDAASTKGLGGWTTGHYFQLMWKDTNLLSVDEHRGTLDIQFELAGTIVMAETFGPMWEGKAICFWIDNTGAAGDIRSKAPKLWRVDLQYLIRRLAKAAMKYRFLFYVKEIEGDNNGLADALSRNENLEKYMSPIQIEMWQKYSISTIVEEIFVDLMKEPLNGKPSNLEHRCLDTAGLSTDPNSPRFDVNEPIEKWSNKFNFDIGNNQIDETASIESDTCHSSDDTVIYV